MTFTRMFPYIENNHPNWLIFFREFQTTNQFLSFIYFRQILQVWMFWEDSCWNWWECIMRTQQDKILRSLGIFLALSNRLPEELSATVTGHMPGGDVWFARCELRPIPRVLAEWQTCPEFGDLRKGDHYGRFADSDHFPNEKGVIFPKTARSSIAGIINIQFIPHEHDIFLIPCYPNPIHYIG